MKPKQHYQQLDYPERKTLTYDRGREMAHHQLLTKIRG